MKHLLIATVMVACLPFCGGAAAGAQSLDDLNLQVHGYATQGFVYSNHNSWDTTDSDKGSASWTDTVVNLSVQPQPKLRIGIQARYYLLGDYGNQVILDWVQADCKVNERFGFRVGKVKSPMGLLNDSQDIDPAQLWILLPQSIYGIASRDRSLSHYGGVVYGTLSLGERFGKLEYRGFGGERIVPGNDGAFQTVHDLGFAVPNGISGKTFGGTLRWAAPIPGLMVGASENSGQTGGEIDAGSYHGTLSVLQFRQTYYFGRLERSKLMLAGEYSRDLTFSDIQFPGAPPFTGSNDQRSFYAMASYRFAKKLTGGMYYSSYLDRKVVVSSARYQKDWVLTARYDFTPFLYAKAEQHFVDGTAIGFAASDNPNLQPDTRMTMLKLGVNF